MKGMTLYKNFANEGHQRTFKMGVNPDPDSVPQAEGVKLCDPTYVHPTIRLFSLLSPSIISISSSDSASTVVDRDEFSEVLISSKVAIIIYRCDVSLPKRMQG